MQMKPETHILQEQHFVISVFCTNVTATQICTVHINVHSKTKQTIELQCK